MDHWIVGRKAGSGEKLKHGMFGSFLLNENSMFMPGYGTDSKDGGFQASRAGMPPVW
jgi:hypothetical protein